MGESLISGVDDIDFDNLKMEDFVDDEDFIDEETRKNDELGKEPSNGTAKESIKVNSTPTESRCSTRCSTAWEFWFIKKEDERRKEEEEKKKKEEEEKELERRKKE